MGQLADAARALLPPAWRPRVDRDAAARPPLSEFGRWLAGEPAERRLSACLDFFLYWLACADARPEDEERRALVAANPRALDLRESAKRAAWAEDARAFADAVHGLLDATNREQRVQFLDLLLLARFCEGRRGAGENVTVRFLGDVLGVRRAELGRWHERACGVSQERFPRLDPDDWWLARPETEDDGEGGDDDGDGGAVLGDEARHRRRLGLAARGPVERVAVAACFERRFALVDPARFDRLGPHERRVAGRLRTRLVEARDALLEGAP